MNRTSQHLLAFSFLFVLALLSAAAQQQRADWVPRGMEELGKTAAFHTDFTFDRSLLQMASGVLYGGEQEVEHAVAKLEGISVHSYRFNAPGMYDPRGLERVREQYRSAGWKHLVSSESHGLYNNTGRTDLWINFRHADVTGMVVLLADDKNLNLIAITGDLSPIDLLHLRGHFGIPRFAGDRFVSAPPDGTRGSATPATGQFETAPSSPTPAAAP